MGGSLVLTLFGVQSTAVAFFFCFSGGFVILMVGCVKESDEFLYCGV